MGTVRRATSAPDLRERAKTADIHLQQMVLQRLFFQRACEQRSHRLSGSQWVAKIHGMVPEQTRSETTIRGEPDTIARAAVCMRHRSDHANGPYPTLELVVLGGTISARWSRDMCQRREQ